MPRWTHKVVYVKTGEWWFGRLDGGKFYHTGLTKPGNAPDLAVAHFNLDMPVEVFYGPPTYEVTKINHFKGNI